MTGKQFLRQTLQPRSVRSSRIRGQSDGKDSLSCLARFLADSNNVIISFFLRGRRHVETMVHLCFGTDASSRELCGAIPQRSLLHKKK